MQLSAPSISKMAFTFLTLFWPKGVQVHFLLLFNCLVILFCKAQAVLIMGEDSWDSRQQQFLVEAAETGGGGRRGEGVMVAHELSVMGELVTRWKGVMGVLIIRRRRGRKS